MSHIQKPFFIFNPKSYLYGSDLLDLVKVGEEIASHTDISVLMTLPFSEIGAAKPLSHHLILSAQHMDPLKPGRGMGHIFAESLKSAGIKATFLNHAEHPQSLSDIAETIRRAKDFDIDTIVCANSVTEAQSIALLEPEVILCEPTDLIGTGQTSDATYVQTTNQAIRDINPDILVMQAAGISTPDDVYSVIKQGADGTGCTSGIVKAPDPANMFKEMVAAVEAAYKEG